MYSRDLERLVRSFVAQKLDREYIKYYLVDTYQIDIATAEEVIDKVSPASSKRSSQQVKALDGGGGPPAIKRQRFY